MNFLNPTGHSEPCSPGSVMAKNRHCRNNYDSNRINLMRYAKCLQDDNPGVHKVQLSECDRRFFEAFAFMYQ